MKQQITFKRPQVLVQDLTIFHILDSNMPFFFLLICECEAPGGLWDCFQKSKCVPVQMQEFFSSIFTSLVQTEHFGRLVATAMTASFERWTPVWRAWRWMHWCWSPYIQSSPWKPKRNVHTMTGQPASESVALLNWSLFLSKKPSEPALFSRKWHSKCLMIQFPTGWLATWL